LAKLIGAWPTLPKQIKTKIKDLIDKHSTKGKADGGKTSRIGNVGNGLTEKPEAYGSNVALLCSQNENLAKDPQTCGYPYYAENPGLVQYGVFMVCSLFVKRFSFK
jgi:hypothetical protein